MSEEVKSFGKSIKIDAGVYDALRQYKDISGERSMSGVLMELLEHKTKGMNNDDTVYYSGWRTDASGDKWFEINKMEAEKYEFNTDALDVMQKMVSYDDNVLMTLNGDARAGLIDDFAVASTPIDNDGSWDFSRYVFGEVIGNAINDMLKKHSK